MNSELYAGARTQEGGPKLVLLNVNNLRLFVYLLVCVKNPAQMKEEEPIKKNQSFFSPVQEEFMAEQSFVKFVPREIFGQKI